MKYVTAVWESEGFHLPRGPTCPNSPKCANCDMGHENAHCVKDLELSRIQVATDKSERLTPCFRMRPCQTSTAVAYTRSH